MKQKLTKECITEATFELLKKKPFEKITVDNIITKAGVCRATFYRNYANSEDVIKDYLASLFTNINELYPIKSDMIYNHTLKMFTELLNYKNELILLGRNQLLYLINDIIFDLTLKISEKFGEESNYYKNVFLTGGSSFVIRAWCLNDFKETPEELTNTLMYKLHLNSNKNH